MKLYKVKYCEVNGGCIDVFKQRWFGTQAEASKFKTAVKRDDEVQLEAFDTVDVPTTKADLLAWLNDNLHTVRGE